MDKEDAYIYIHTHTTATWRDPLTKCSNQRETNIIEYRLYVES